jgi:hypothetical protein
MKSRQYWLRLIAIGIAFEIFAFLGSTFLQGFDDPHDPRRILFFVFCFMVFLGIVGLIVLLLIYLVVILSNKNNDPSTFEDFSPDKMNAKGFPVITDASQMSVSGQGPGQYRVQGVHRQTKMDISKYIQADSAANAQVKAELEDIVVTSVTKVVL